MPCRSLDVPLVSPGVPTPFPTVSQQPDMCAGMSFNLANNIWGTNYVMWQPYDARDANMRFRFVIEAAHKLWPEAVQAEGLITEVTEA